MTRGKQIEMYLNLEHVRAVLDVAIMDINLTQSVIRNLPDPSASELVMLTGLLDRLEHSRADIERSFIERKDRYQGYDNGPIRIPDFLSYVPEKPPEDDPPKAKKAVKKDG